MAKANTSTGRSSSVLDTALAPIPDTFRLPILREYAELKRRYHAGDVNGCGQAVTQFCEDVLRWVQNTVIGAGKHDPFGHHIKNFGKSCDDLDSKPKGAFDDALRVLVPRALKFLHSMRSQRGFVHTPGTVSANMIDLATMSRVADWVMAEILRTSGKMDLGAAQALIDSLSYRDMPDLWYVNGKVRVLKSDLPYKDEVLLIAFNAAGEAVFADDLIGSLEYSNPSTFRKSVLANLHRDRLIEFDQASDSIIISPRGAADVEDRILKSIAKTT